MSLKRALAYSTALLSCVALCASAFYMGQRSADRSAKMQAEYLAVINAALTYSLQADVAKAIQAKDETKALCMVSLRASMLVNTVQQCLKDSSCKRLVESEIQAVAPELLGSGELRIKYYAEGQMCP